MLLSDDERLDLIINALAILSAEACKGSMGQLRELEQAVSRLASDRDARAEITKSP